jgi:microsomal epoxide hydrolase
LREFTVHIDQAALDDVAQRLASTRWLDDGDVQPGSGASVAFVRQLRDHWLHHFDWRALEARINREPNFIVDIDGLDIHFVHRRSSRADAIPLLLIHGWPSSFLEFIDLCDALAKPQGDAPAFHVVIPSLPGYGFSTTRAGVSPRRVTAIFAELMTRLGHKRFIAQGGNWGAAIGTEMARQWPDRVIGLHLNAINGSPPPAEAKVELSAEDQALADVYSRVLAYPHFNLVCQTPLTTAHAMNDSPAGLAAWVGEKLYDWADGELPDNRGRSLDWMVATSALYWFTATMGSANALYREAVLDQMAERYVTVPTALAHFARETVVIPRAWAEHHYNIVRWTPYPSGGHYAGLEVPDLFVGDLRAFASALCNA